MKLSPAYKRHREALQNMKPVIDNFAPRLKVGDCLATVKLYGDTLEASKLRYKNEQLVKGIHCIYRSQGPVICHLEKQFKCSTGAAYEERTRDERKFINQQNKQLKKICSKVESEYSQENARLNLLLLGIQISSEKPWKRKNQFTILPSHIEAKPSARQTCFFEIEADGFHVGRMEILLYNDIVPQAAENFISICTIGPEGSYEETVFFRIVPGLFCLGGDNVNRTGTGGKSSFGEGFPDENHLLVNGGPGTVSMYKRANNLNDSQFLITFEKLSALDDKFMVIGRVTRGMNVLQIIEYFGTAAGKPKRKVKIIRCGLKMKSDVLETIRKGEVMPTCGLK